MCLYIAIAAIIGCGAPAPTEHILFLGNSHTYNNDVPMLVRSLLNSAGQTRYDSSAIYGAFLNDIANNPQTRNAFSNTKWAYVVLQGAQLSSSHRYDYQNDGAIALAKLAIKNGARPLYFVEWPRRGWDESDWQYGKCRELANKGGGELLPICYAWDAANKANGKLSLWSSDGNHATLQGSYLAASVIAYWISGTRQDLTWSPSSLDASIASFLRRTAKTTVDKYK